MSLTKIRSTITGTSSIQLIYHFTIMSLLNPINQLKSLLSKSPTQQLPIKGVSPSSSRKLKSIHPSIEYYLLETHRKQTRFLVPKREQFKQSCLKFIQQYKLPVAMAPSRRSSLSPRQRGRQTFDIQSQRRMDPLNKSCDCNECGFSQKYQRLMISLLPKLLNRYNQRKTTLWRFKKIVNAVIFLIRYKILQQKKMRQKRRIQKLMRPSVQLPTECRSYIDPITSSPRPKSNRPKTQNDKHREQQGKHAGVTEDNETDSPELKPRTTRSLPKAIDVPKTMDHLYNLAPRKAIFINAYISQRQSPTHNTQNAFSLRNLNSLEHKFSKQPETLFKKRIKLRCFKGNKFPDIANNFLSSRKNSYYSKPTSPVASTLSGSMQWISRPNNIPKTQRQPSNEYSNAKQSLNFLIKSLKSIK